MSRLCIFCSKQSKSRSREHVIPKWLWPLVGITKLSPIRSVHKGRIGPSGSPPFVIKDLADKVIGGFVEGRVCTQCNTGWMSKLENAVKPFLTTILDIPTLVDEWPIEDRGVLARWVVKTALMAISTSVVSQNVPDEHFNAIKRGIILPGISVFVGYHALVEKGFSYEAGRHWGDVEMPAETPDKLKDEISGALNQHSYKVCLQLRSLLLMAAFSPTPQLVLSSDDATHQLIWTERPITQRRNPPIFTGPRGPFAMLLTSDNARRRFADLMRMIWVPVPR
jgi:hypothetical protein